MRALMGRVYKGLQAAAALYILTVLALPTPPAPAPAVEPATPPAREPAASTAALPTEPVAPTADAVATRSEPAPEVVREQSRERTQPAIGFNIPEGQFNFEPAPGAEKLAGAEAAAPAFPFAPPAPAPGEQPAAPPIVHRRGRFHGPMRIVRNPWSDPANLAFNNRGNAGRARAFAFDDRPEPPPGTAGSVDPATVLKSWRHDIEQYRLMANQGHREDELAHRLGDRFSSVRWAAGLDASLDELPPPTESYAAALARERKPTRQADGSTVN